MFFIVSSLNGVVTEEERALDPRVDRRVGTFKEGIFFSVVSMVLEPAIDELEVGAVLVVVVVVVLGLLNEGGDANPRA